jgi:hypothetical protein
VPLLLLVCRAVKCALMGRSSWLVSRALLCEHSRIPRAAGSVTASSRMAGR